MGAEGNAAMAAMSLEVGGDDPRVRHVERRCIFSNGLDTGENWLKMSSSSFLGTQTWFGYVQYFNLNHPCGEFKDC